jgi:hypothetical protein
MSEVLTLQPDPVNERLVTMLEKVLKLAQDGEINGAALAFTWSDGDTGNCFQPGPSNGLLIGAMRILETEIIECNIETRCHPAGLTVGD